MGIGKDIEKLEPSSTALKLCRDYGKQFGSFSKGSELPWPNSATSRYEPKRIENRRSNKNMYRNVHSSILHNDQKVETTQMSIN